MRKDDLRKLRALNATKEMMEKADRTVEVECAKYDYEQHAYIEYKKMKQEYHLFMRCQNLGAYLKIAIFFASDIRKGIWTPKYEIFINKAGKEYITRELDEDGQESRWLTGMIENLPEIWKYDSEVVANQQNKINKTFINHDGRRSLKELIKHEGIKAENKDAERMIYYYQKNVREQRIKERERKEQEPWDADMKLMPKVPDGFRAWMETEVVRDDYIIYEYKKGGAKTGFCRHCRKEVPIKKIPHHRENYKCPVCGRESVLISAGRIKKIASGKYYRGTLIQRIPSGFTIREFAIRCWIKTEDYTRPGYYMYEYQRILVRGNRTDTYRYEMYKNKFIRWCKAENWRPWVYETSKEVYRKNIASVVKSMDGHSGLASMINTKKEIPVAEYLYMESHYPAIEKLAKAEMEQMALEYVKRPYDFKDAIKEGETELHKMLRIDKNRMKRLRELGAGKAALTWIQAEKRENTVWDNEMIRAFAGAGIEPKDLNFISGRMSYKKICNYLEKQTGAAGESMWQTVQTWKDYLNMAEKLKMDIGNEMIYKPKNIWEAHAEAIEQTESKGIEKVVKEIKKRFPEVDDVCRMLGKYEFEDEDYCIKVPSGILDIVREGTVLRHCIHTCDYYFDRIVNRESYLVFLRRKKTEKTPWYTIEVEPGGNIRQKRTVGDNQNRDLDAAVPFLRNWQKEIRRRLNEEEKELAKEADRKRKENYEELRKNGNTIWHGRLQGKLLADVLEQDFMEAI